MMLVVIACVVETGMPIVPAIAITVAAVVSAAEAVNRFVASPFYGRVSG
jgi:hypothetical protein